MAQLKGSDSTELTVIPLNRAIRSNVDTIQEARTVLEATHVLHGSLKDENGKLLLHAYLTDTRSQINTKEWRLSMRKEKLDIFRLLWRGW